MLRHHVHHSQWLQPPSGLCWAWGGGGGTTGGPGAWGLPGRWAPDHLRFPGHPDPEPCPHCRLLPRGKQICAKVTPLFIIKFISKSVAVYSSDSAASYIIRHQSAALLPLITESRSVFLLMWWCSVLVNVSLCPLTESLCVYLLAERSSVHPSSGAAGQGVWAVHQTAAAGPEPTRYGQHCTTHKYITPVWTCTS